MNTTIDEIEQLMEGFIKENNAHIIIPKPLPVIICDKPRVTELFRNLITNAIKYNDKPERIVEIGFLENIKHRDKMQKDVFYVKDNGIGIEEKFHDQIFRIFKRLKADPNKEEGSGVGLSFVKRLLTGTREIYGLNLSLEKAPHSILLWSVSAKTVNNNTLLQKLFHIRNARKSNFCSGKAFALRWKHSY